MQKFGKDIIDCFMRGSRLEIETRIVAGKTFKGTVNSAFEAERRLPETASLRKLERLRSKRDSENPGVNNRAVSGEIS